MPWWVWLILALFMAAMIVVGAYTRCTVVSQLYRRFPIPHRK